MTKRRRAAKARQPGSAEECRQRALRLLGLRPRSRRDLEQALALRGFDPGAIAATLSSLERSGLLDEKAALESLLASRRRRYGRERVRRELAHRGFEEADVRRAAGAISEAEDLDLLRSLCRRRERELAGEDPEKRRRKLFDFLRRRGFAPERILAVMGEDGAS